MGAHNFEATAFGATPQEAYEEAVQDSLFEYGHNPYNGTISTTNGFVMIPKEDGETDGQWHNRVIDDDRVQKWEDCACREDTTEPEVNGRKLWVFSGWAAS